MPQNKEDLFKYLLIGNVVVTLFLAGWLVWISADPQYWFPSAYAEKGEQGDEGPVGEQGPRGEQGPVGRAGPDAEDALDLANDLDSRMSDLEDQIYDLQGGIEAVGANSSQIAQTATDTCEQLSDLMDTLEQGDFIYGGYVDCPYLSGD